MVSEALSREEGQVFVALVDLRLERWSQIEARS